MGARQKRAGFTTTAFARVGKGIDNDEGDEYDYGNKSKEEAFTKDGEVMGGGRDNVCSDTNEVHRYTDTKLHHGISRYLDCTLHPTCFRLCDLSITIQS